MFYLFTVSKTNPPSTEVINDITRRHAKPGLPVVMKVADIEKSFTIEKVDSLINERIKTDKDLRLSMENKVIREVAREKAILKDAAKYNKDQTLLAGEKPYEPVKIRND